MIKLTKQKLKEIIKEELQNLNELQTFPPFEIAKRMLKNKKFGNKWAKQIIRKFRGRGVSEKSLNKFLSGKFSKKDIDAIWGAEFEGKITEAKESVIDVARRIVQNGQYEKYKGMMLDTFTASAIIKVYDAVNDSNKKKLDSLKLPKLVNIVWKLLKKVS